MYKRGFIYQYGAVSSLPNQFRCNYLSMNTNINLKFCYCIHNGPKKSTDQTSFSKNFSRNVGKLTNSSLVPHSYRFILLLTPAEDNTLIGDLVPGLQT